MNAREKVFLVIGGIVCAGCGAGFEHLRRPCPSAAAGGGLPPEPAVAAAPVGVRFVRDEAAARALRGDLKALLARVAELEKALAARDAALAELKQKKVDQDALASRRPRREDFRQRLEQLKKENPTLYAEMEKRREEFHQRLEQEKQDSADFLASVNMQDMSEEQKANHQKLLDMLAKVEALRAQREQANAEPGSEADQTFHQTMGQAMAELGALYDTERVYLLTQAANAAGYAGDDANQFVAYIQQTVQSTTMRGGPGGPPPGM